MKIPMHSMSQMIEQLIELQQKPEPFTPGEASFWDDPYISEQMLKAHTDFLEKQIALPIHLTTLSTRTALNSPSDRGVFIILRVSSKSKRLLEITNDVYPSFSLYYPVHCFVCLNC